MLFNKSNPAWQLCQARRKWRHVVRNARKYTDEELVRLKYRRVFGVDPDLRNPLKFSEKIQWMKLHANDPLRAKCTDKYAVREYVEGKGHGEILNELIGVYTDAEQIDFEALPSQFVIRATHGCGWNFICPDKERERKNWPGRKKLLNQWLRQNYALQSRELHYARITPRLVCERYLAPADGSQLKDMKIFCFNGEPGLIAVDYDRFGDHSRHYFDPRWKLTNIVMGARYNESQGEARPANLDEILRIARDLSAGFPFVRVDLYPVDDRIYFGELTFTPGSGFKNPQPKGTDLVMGGWFDLPISIRDEKATAVTHVTAVAPNLMY